MLRKDMSFEEIEYKQSGDDVRLFWKERAILWENQKQRIDGH